MATTSRAVIANRRYYIPAHDIKCKYFEPSNKRHRWARGEQIWYNLNVKSKIIKNCCYGYPNPKTHAYLKNHITFLTGKDGISICACNNTLSSSLFLSNNNSNNNNKMKNKNIRNESQALKVINSEEMIVIK